MKKFPFLILTLVAFETNSQTYHPFPDSNIVWIQRDWYIDFAINPPCTITNDYDLFISGDTIIGSYTYRKLYSSGHIYASCPPPGWYYSAAYWGAFRQDVPNKKVYLFKNGVDTLAYDFNLNVGDTLPPSCLEGSEYNFVQSIDTVLIGSQYHKRFWLTSFGIGATNYAELVEGIGTSQGVFIRMQPPFERGNELFCVLINNIPVYPDTSGCAPMSINQIQENPSTFTIIPNPFSFSATLQTSKDFSNSVFMIFNTLGKKVKQQIINDSTSIINRDELFAGICFFQIMNNKGQTATGKIIML